MMQSTVSAAAANCGPEATDATATTLLLDQVEQDLLSYWLLRGGGGKEGDANITALLFQSPGLHPKFLLTAEGLGAKVLEKFHHDLILSQSEALVQRLHQSPTVATISRALNDPCGPDVLSPAVLCARIQYLFALSQLESLLMLQGTTKILAKAVLASRGFGDRNVMHALMGLTRDEIYADMCGAVGGIADRVFDELVEMKKAAEINNTDRNGNSTDGKGLKFVGDDDMRTAFEGKYESESVFHEGLDKFIGLPDPKVLSAMIDEHQNHANSAIEYVSSNYNLTCMPKQELEAVLRPQSGTNYPGMGTGMGKRELPPLRVYLSAAGCLDGYQYKGKEVGNEKVGEKKVTDAAEISSVCQELEALCGPLVLNEEDTVKEALCLLMMGRQGSAKTVCKVQTDMFEDGGTVNMELFFKIMKTQDGWTEEKTLKAIQKGRERFKTAALCPEEVLGLRLYTGPQFMHYNCVLRKFPKDVLESLKGNTYTTTIHCINSAIVKLSRACPLDPRRVARGSNRLRLPERFAVKDKLGCQGAVEMGFISTSTNLEVACNYTRGGVMAMVLDIERGAMDKGASIGPLSQYFMEEEILFPPLCNLEVRCTSVFACFTCARNTCCLEMHCTRHALAGDSLRCAVCACK